jgi:hypothetical protein
MPRKRSDKWMTFEEAKEFIQSQGVQSRQQYIDWWDDNKPKSLSKYPQRVYTDEWEGWNDFLGTNNEFNKTRRSWRSFEEAVIWVHKQGIQGGKPGWLQWVKDNPDSLPEDIPKRPDITYKKDWLSWKHWLGDSVTERVEAQQTARSAAVYYIIREKDYAHVNNVYSFGIEPGGVAALKDRWKLEQFQVVKLFQFDTQRAPEVEKIVTSLSTPYFGDGSVRAVPNIYDLCWELVGVVDPIN